MTMDRLELLAARAADGLATLEELAELAVGLESADEAPLLREALLFEAGGIDIMDSVMAALDPSGSESAAIEFAAIESAALEPEDAWLSAFADGQLGGERRALVAARLERDPAARALVGDFARVAASVSEAVASERGAAPNVWPAVARQLGLDPEHVPGWNGAVLREAVLAEAGSVDVVPQVLDRVRPASRVPAAAVPSWRRWIQAWSLPAFGLAAAAALLLSFPSFAPDAPGPMSFRVSPVNHVQIEDISTDSADAMVQVLQFDEDAPTIIFIEEFPAGEQGATL